MFFWKIDHLVAQELMILKKFQVKNFFFLIRKKKKKSKKKKKLKKKKKKKKKNEWKCLNKTVTIGFSNEQLP